jgi:hypothetical protein
MLQIMENAAPKLTLVYQTINNAAPKIQELSSQRGSSVKNKVLLFNYVVYICGFKILVNIPVSLFIPYAVHLVPVCR